MPPPHFSSARTRSKDFRTVDLHFNPYQAHDAQVPRKSTRFDEDGISAADHDSEADASHSLNLHPGDLIRWQLPCYLDRIKRKQEIRR